MRTLLKRIIEQMLEWWVDIPYNVLRIRDKRYADTLNDILLRVVLKLYEQKTDYYFAYQVFPKYARDYVDVDNPGHLPLYAVILQGPLKLQDHFTLETVRLYKKIFPNGLIIVSSWKDADQDEVNKIEQEGAVVILSELPSCCGLANVNYQFVSTYEGIKEAKRLGAEYVFKTRTDNRIYRNSLFEELYTLMKENPCENALQEERIVTLGGRSGNIFWPYWQADVFMFGNINDMQKFFNMPLQEDTSRDAYGFREPSNVTGRWKTQHDTNAETFIFRRYLKSLGLKLNYSVRGHWDIITKMFLPISENYINLYWLAKYETRYENNRRGGIYRVGDKEYKASGYNFDYFKWKIIKNGIFQYKERFEAYQEMIRDNNMIVSSEYNEARFNELIESYNDELDKGEDSYV